MDVISILVFMGIAGSAMLLTALIPIGPDTHKHRRDLVYSLMTFVVLLTVLITFMTAQMIITAL